MQKNDLKVLRAVNIDIENHPSNGLRYLRITVRVGSFQELTYKGKTYFATYSYAIPIDGINLTENIEYVNDELCQNLVGHIGTKVELSDILDTEILNAKE